jgi:hypothetical protein
MRSRRSSHIPTHYALILRPPIFTFIEVEKVIRMGQRQAVHQAYRQSLPGTAAQSNYRDGVNSITCIYNRAEANSTTAHGTVAVAKRPVGFRGSRVRLPSACSIFTTPFSCRSLGQNACSLDNIHSREMTEILRPCGCQSRL